MDANNNVFALSNGVIYPISRNVVDEAKDFVLNQQPEYMDYVKNQSMSNTFLMLPPLNVGDLRFNWNKAEIKNLVLFKNKNKIIF